MGPHLCFAELVDGMGWSEEITRGLPCGAQKAPLTEACLFAVMVSQKIAEKQGYPFVVGTRML